MVSHRRMAGSDVTHCTQAPQRKLTGTEKNKVDKPQAGSYSQAYFKTRGLLPEVSVPPSPAWSPKGYRPKELPQQWYLTRCLKSRIRGLRDDGREEGRAVKSSVGGGEMAHW